MLDNDDKKGYLNIKLLFSFNSRSLDFREITYKDFKIQIYSYLCSVFTTNNNIRNEN